ncbi:hypothetical protein, partial [Acidithiobacillus thiooxidans]|uniref:hypothetical protein n=1 Tax=Acidithiobacillus thiooxidans TaxID=930 RepID=UPI001A7E1530
MYWLYGNSVERTWNIATPYRRKGTGEAPRSEGLGLSLAGHGRTGQKDSRAESWDAFCGLASWFRGLEGSAWGSSESCR